MIQSVKIDWYGEVQFYNKLDKSCKLGKQCGHYRQVICKCVCVYVYVGMCMFMCMYLFVVVCVCECMYVCVYVCVCVCVHVSVCMYVYVLVCARACVCACIGSGLVYVFMVRMFAKCIYVYLCVVYDCRNMRICV